jgi:pantetheine-phosphate adenylyltransferase
MKRIAIFPGSFDPFTKGHYDIVVRSIPLFDEIIIAVGHNSSKQRYFELEYMIEKIKSCFLEYPQVKVETFQGLTAEFARSKNATYLIRGLRNTTDFEYENSICQVNRSIWSELETIFMITSPAYAYISSTIIRDLHKYNGNIESFLPYRI